MEWDSKLSALIEEYRTVRARIRTKRQNLFGRARRLVGRLADTPHLKYFLSVETQQACFTVSLTIFLFALYLVWTRPALYKLLYVPLITTLVAARGVMYTRQSWAPFMFDFCYFVNALVVLTTTSVVPSPVYAAMGFILTNGPVLWAIVIWRNSLVLHSIDKMTSFTIHFFPALCTYVDRFALGGEEVQPAFSLATAVLYPLGFYACWQIGYIIVFDVLLVERFRQNEELESALRWFTRRDKDSSLAQGALAAARRVGFFGPTEDLDSFSWKTRIVFYSTQLVYTFCTFPFAWISYASAHAHAVCLFLTFLVATNSGATFYLSNAFVRQRVAFYEAKNAALALAAAAAQDKPELAAAAGAVASAAAALTRNRSVSAATRAGTGSPPIAMPDIPAIAAIASSNLADLAMPVEVGVVATSLRARRSASSASTDASSAAASPQIAAKALADKGAVTEEEANSTTESESEDDLDDGVEQ